MNSSGSLANFSVTRLRSDVQSTCDDVLVVEEPLEIRIEGRRYTATMRTPGNDDLLARGLLFCEGVIEDNDDIEKLTQSTLCRERSDELVNLVDVTLHDSTSIPAHLWERSLISNASCGLCGKSSVDAMTAQVGALPESGALPQEVLWSLNEQMRQRQALFQQTGGLHAAGIFSANGECLALFEDIGRHNATDKAIGFGLLNGWLPWNQAEPAVLLISGRASFEITQKALRARLPIVAAVSAASSLAVDLAVAHNLTLLGFLRERGCTIYCGAQRIAEGE